jgi:hypothetical protein
MAQLAERRLSLSLSVKDQRVLECNPECIPGLVADRVFSFIGFGRTGSRLRVCGGGKSGLRRRGYQRKAGGRKATESATENIPLCGFAAQEG